MAQSQQLVYLDYAAATPVDERVLKAMQPYWAAKYYNPAALYAPARQVRGELEAARAAVAKVLGAKATEIIWTAGATESINLAIQGVLKLHPGQAVVSAIEHVAVMNAASTATICAVKPNGLVDLKTLNQAITDHTVLVSIGYVNNEIGVIQPLAKIGQLVKQLRADRLKRGIKRPLYLHTDASQAPSYLALDVNRLGVDLLTLNGNKIYGPKQSGCLYVKSGINLAPLIVGGGQERGLRSGTENTPAAIGFAKALELAQANRQTENRRLSKLQTALWQQLQASITGVRLNGDSKLRVAGNLNILIPGVNGETLVHYLDQQGILVATGAACAANHDQPSAVLLALGLSVDEVNSSLRISLGRQTTAAQLKRFIDALQIALKQLAAHG